METQGVGDGFEGSCGKEKVHFSLRSFPLAPFSKHDFHSFYFLEIGRLMIKKGFYNIA